MIRFGDAKSLSSVFTPDDFNPAQGRYFIGFCLLLFVVALLEFGQDYVSAILNDNSFVIADSLSYKLFWPLFIPLSVALDYCCTKADKLFPRVPYMVLSAIPVLAVTLVHLLVFSCILFGISVFIHEDPMSLMSLIYEKFSTRLYIALSAYAALSALFLFVMRRQSRNTSDHANASKTITVKNGKSSVIVDVSTIKWIGSDGAYLDIHTAGQKHVVLGSLKNRIKELPPNFKRIHRSTIVNIDCIKELKSRGNGDYDVILDDDRVLRLSRNYAKQLKGTLL